MTRQIRRVIHYYNKNKSRRVQIMCELSFVGVINGSGLDLFDNVTEGCIDM